MNISKFLQHGVELCQSWIPDSEYRELYGALVCGQSITHGPYRQLFADTGLIHLLVVSGAHLHFMEAWLKVFSPGMRLWLLGSYCWLTGFGAPVVRAWLRRFCDRFSRKFGVSAVQAELITLLLAIFIYPDWLWSKSFLMCWVCALALTLPPLFPAAPALSLSITCYALLFPFVPSAPSTVLCNALITPVIGALLFPLCTLAVLLPPLTLITDELWRMLLLVLRELPSAAPAPFVSFGGWWFLYPLVLHVLILVAEVPWRRARAFST